MSIELDTVDTPVSELSDAEVMIETVHWLDVAGPRERRHVLGVLRRLVKLGQRIYGPLQESDGRDFIREAYEEVEDMAVYLREHLLRKGSL